MAPRPQISGLPLERSEASASTPLLIRGGVWAGQEVLRSHRIAPPGGVLGTRRRSGAPQIAGRAHRGPAGQRDGRADRAGA